MTEQATVPAPTAMPRQGWAHLDGVVELRRNQPILPDRALDRLMIHEAFARWGMAWDEGRDDVVASLFTDKATIELLEGSATPIAVVAGASEIVEYVMRTRQVQDDQRRHAMSNIVVEDLDDDRALAVAYGIVTIAKGGQMTVGATVIYRATLVRQPGGDWRFEHFVIGMDAYARGTA